MVDLTELERELRLMRPRQKFYELIKAEMQRRGRWRNKSRGKAFTGGYDSRRAS